MKKTIVAFGAALLLAMGSSAYAASTPVSCSPYMNSTTVNTPVTLTASGGNGTYTWYEYGSVVGTGSTYTSTHQYPGTYLITVESVAKGKTSSATCSIDIPLTSYPSTN